MEKIVFETIKNQTRELKRFAKKSLISFLDKQSDKSYHLSEDEDELILDVFYDERIAVTDIKLETYHNELAIYFVGYKIIDGERTNEVVVVSPIGYEEIVLLEVVEHIWYEKFFDKE